MGTNGTQKTSIFGLTARGYVSHAAVRRLSAIELPQKRHLERSE